MNLLIWKKRERIKTRMWRTRKNESQKRRFTPILYCFEPHDSFIYNRNFDNKLQLPSLQANCNFNAISVQCMQLAISLLFMSAITISLSLSHIWLFRLKIWLRLSFAYLYQKSKIKKNHVFSYSLFIYNNAQNIKWKS